MNRRETPEAPPTPAQREFEALLEFIKQHRGFDFTGYRRGSLQRRIDKRMGTAGIEGYANYQTFLDTHPGEFAQLFNTILINVTAFFRDPSAWEYLSEEVLPRILGNAGDSPIRIWSAGCAAGHEPYSLAMALNELMGLERFRRQIKIYATDVDEIALEQARRAIYTDKELESVPAALRPKYFRPLDGHFVFHTELRRGVIFGRHDLTTDAPISRVDLLVCRNTLMYFNPDTQARILARFHFALNAGGYLFLGRSEMLLTHTNLFTPIELKFRLFAKAQESPAEERMTGLPPAGLTRRTLVRELDVLEKAGYEQSPVAQAVIDRRGVLVSANQRARTLFNLEPAALGRPFGELPPSAIPAEVRDTVDRALKEMTTVEAGKVKWPLANGSITYLEVTAMPQLDRLGNATGVVLTFRDVTVETGLQDKLLRVQQDLETSLEEVQSSNEEMETTNEELQSSNEELETTNEELQSANEELETMNEELQSSNDELQEMNARLHVRTEELHSSAAYLSAIVHSHGWAVIAVDRHLDIQLWNEWAEDWWGVREEEVKGHGLLGLDLGLPVDSLNAGLRRCLEENGKREELDLPGRDRRGHNHLYHATLLPIRDVREAVEGVVIVLETAEREVSPPPGAD